MGEPPISYGKARRIKFAERDRRLGVDGADWPDNAPPGWEKKRGYLRRTIHADAGAEREIPRALEEMVLRFPSAPLHGFQRLHEHHIVTLGPSENFHTFRLLRSNNRRHLSKPVSRIFLMHTGLNERDTMGLYYRLASELIWHDPSTVCIVRPFPGHMTRYPFRAFAETPLDNYLSDGSHLFRQFLRFMIETQWLLSAMVRRSSYRAASGATLLGEDEDPKASRLDPEKLAAKIELAWDRLYRASKDTAEAEWSADEPDRPTVNIRVAGRKVFEQAIQTLRDALRLERHYPAVGGDLDGDGASDPAVHVLGYSLGGFTAQSVFMSWPFLIASCSTLLAGGALRELAPTAFADPEEWQTVLHSLRYELDDRMMSPHLGVSEDAVAGIDRSLFMYLKRTFYEVFQQEYRGSFQTRIEAFRHRMLFIVGGNDPIVRPKSVLDSAPKGGLNLLEIGGLGHFLEGGGADPAEGKQKTFWLPEMAALMHRFADNAANDQAKERPFTWFDSDLAQPARDRVEWDEQFPSAPSAGPDGQGVRRLSPAEVIAIDRDGALPGESFERCLDDLLYRVATGPEGGFLFVLRNEIPTVLLDPTVVRETAAALYHDDFSIVRYCHGVAARSKVVDENISRICFVLPWNARRIMARMDLQRGYPSQSESAGGQVAPRLTKDKVWEYSEKRLRTLAQRRDTKGSVRVFDGNVGLPDNPDDDTRRLLDLAKTFAGKERQPLDKVPSLPDCWLWVSREALVGNRKAQIDIARARRRLLEAIPDICADPETTLNEIREGRIRMVTVSKARYNPRFRGRLMVDGGAARKLLTHIGLCLCQSERIGDLKTPFLASQHRGDDAESADLPA